MKALADLRLFVRTARAASLSEAARALDMSPAAASAAIKRLEAELGVALFLRSTRSLSLTREGQAFLAECEQALNQLTRAAERLRGDHDRLGGAVRLSVPSEFDRHRVLGWLNAFQAPHPAVQIRLLLSDPAAGPRQAPPDIALRYGDLPDVGLMALTLAPENRRVLCASPAYLARHGTPVDPRELAQHNCLCVLRGERVHSLWTFEHGGSALRVEVAGRFQADDGDAVRRMALAGQGVAYPSLLDVAADLRSGALVALCSDWQGEPAPLKLVCADRRPLRPVVQRLRDFLVECCTRWIDETRVPQALRA